MGRQEGKPGPEAHHHWDATRTEDIKESNQARAWLAGLRLSFFFFFFGGGGGRGV